MASYRFPTLPRLALGLTLACLLASLAPAHANRAPSPELQAVLGAFRKLGEVRWQGVRELQFGDRGPTVVVQDGFEPRTGYFFGPFEQQAGPVGANQTATVPAGPVPASDTTGPVRTLADRIGLLAPMHAAGLIARLEERAATLKVTKAPQAASILSGTLRGDAYLVEPTYTGGKLKVVVDRHSGLPVEVERVGVNGQIKYRTRYRTILANVPDGAFWFVDALAHPDQVKPLEALGPMGHPPRGERLRHHLRGGGLPLPVDELPPLLLRAVNRFKQGVLPESFHLEPVRHLVSREPMPTVHFVLSDGLNPISIVAIRCPRGMNMREAERRAWNRLNQRTQQSGTPAALKRHNNWLLIATGEVDQTMLEGLAERATEGLGELQGLLARQEQTKGHPPPGGPPRGEGARPPHEGSPGGHDRPRGRGLRRGTPDPQSPAPPQ